MKKGSKIYIAGHKGMVGSAVWRALTKNGYTNLVGKTRTELDLRNPWAVNNFLKKEQPVAIIDAAAKVGGILANSEDQYGFLLENLQIQNNLIQAAHKNACIRRTHGSCPPPSFLNDLLTHMASARLILPGDCNKILLFS